MPATIDALIKNEQGSLEPYNLNGPAFVDWFTDEIGPLTGQTSVLIGVGGAGESIARELAGLKPAELLLIDPVDKHSLAEELVVTGAAVRYLPSLATDETPMNATVVINAAGKEGVSNDVLIEGLLVANQATDRVFIDLRPQLALPIVDLATQLGWRAYTGHGMNARNDYVLLTKALARTPIQPPTFVAFQQLVARAS